MNKIKGDRSRGRINQRRTEAKEREADRCVRSNEEQLKLLETRPGNSEKEKHRLVALIDKTSKNIKKKKRKK
jgi:hypothetical protein